MQHVGGIGQDNPQWRGGRRVDWQGYVQIAAFGHPRTHKNNTAVPEHVLIAERALGRFLAVAAPVHHVNEDKSDNRNCNLVICQDNAYHRLLHRRARVVAAGGNPNTERICCKCKQVLPNREFNANVNGPDGLQTKCRACSVEYTRIQRGSRRRNRRKAETSDAEA
jgi:hypothetical protein